MKTYLKVLLSQILIWTAIHHTQAKNIWTSPLTDKDEISIVSEDKTRATDSEHLTPSDFILTGSESKLSITNDSSDADFSTLSTFTTNGSSTSFSDPAAWDMGLPPNDGTADIVIAHDLDMDIDFTANDLTVNPGVTLTIKPGKVLKVTGTLTNNGLIYFESDGVNGSAQFDEFTGMISGSGEVTVERFIPAKRIKRFHSSTVNTAGSSRPFINDNWQEGATTASTDPNPKPGYGTHITKKFGSEGTVAEGFDQTSIDDITYDLAIYNNVQQEYQAWPNTKPSSLNVGRPYRIFMRGDRSIDINDLNATPTNTILRSTGDLHVGSLSYGVNESSFFKLSDVSGDVNLVTNPYQSVVDYSEVTRNNDLTNYINVWDADLGGDGDDETRGGYVTVELPDAGGAISAPSPYSSEANHFIPPGRPFFVKISGTTPEITFEEDDKATGNNTVNINTTEPDFYINSRVYKTSDLLSANTESDALGLRFRDDYNNTASIDEDAPFDFINSRVQYTIINNAQWKIDKRKVPVLGEEIQFLIDYGPFYAELDPETNNYSLTFDMLNKPDDLGVYLIDDFFNPGDLDYETELTEGIVYDFNIDINDDLSDNESSTYFFRFKLKFDTPTNTYIWEAGFDDNFNNKRVFKGASFATNIKTLTVEATADGNAANDDTYRIFERSENDKWQNASTAFNEVFTLSHGGAGSPDGITNPAATAGDYYTVQIDGYDVNDREAVFMVTNNAPIEFATNNAITLPTTEIMAGQPVTLNINLAGNKSSQERAFVVYSTNEFATSDFVEVTFNTPTSDTGTATIPGFVLGTLVEFYAYTTTIDVNAIGTPNHDLYTLRQGKDFGENYIYNVGPEHMTKGGATDWNQMSSWLRNQVPPDGSDVIIAHDLILTDNQTVQTIEFVEDAVLNGTGELSIQNGGNVTNSNAAEVSIDPTVNFIGVGSVTGEVAFNAVDINGGVDFGNPGDGNQSTINGSLSILPGGFVLINSPFYGVGSTLVYNTGGDYGRNSEWSNTSATQGRPFNVIVKNGTVLEFATLTNDKTIAAEIDGDFTIEPMTSALMSSEGNDMVAPLIVGGDFINEGFYLLSAESGGDLLVNGDFIDIGNVREFNNRAIFFVGSNDQNLTVPDNLQIPYLVIDKSGGQVILQQDIIISGNGGTALDMRNDGVLNLNDHQLQIGNDTDTSVSFSDNAGLVGSLDSRIVFSSTNGSAGDLTFLQDASAYENYLSEFEMNGPGSIGVSDTLNIYLRFLLNGGNFNSNGHLTFKSSETTTAIIPAVTSGSITGDVRIERHFPQSNRAFRYVSSPVTTTLNINANWQEGATTGDLNPNPGYGTHITGVPGTAGLVNANGLDETQTGNPSLFTFDETLQDWVSVNSTIPNTLEVGVPHALMVRGDRSTNLNSNDAVGPATTLRTSGEIKIGLHSPAIDNAVSSGDFVLVGNPYQAQVDMSVLFGVPLLFTNINPDFMWIWDPNLGNQGGYAIVDLSDGSQVDEDLTTPVIPRTSEANQFLQPFQACFLQVTNNSPNIIFAEGLKIEDTDNIGTFSSTTVQTNVLNIELEQQNTQILVDAVKLSFAPNYTTPGSFEDAAKLWNITEQLALVNANDYLSIDKRNLPQVNDTVPLYLGNYQESQYTLKLESTLESDIPAILYDEYLDQTLVLNFGDNTYDFSVDASIPESTAGQRFKLVFNPETLGTEDLVSTTPFSVYPNPTDDILYINSDKTFLGQEVELTCFDQTGRLVLSESISKLEANTSLDLSRLSAGLYLLKLETDGHQETFKIQVR